MKKILPIFLFLLFGVALLLLFFSQKNKSAFFTSVPLPTSEPTPGEIALPTPTSSPELVVLESDLSWMQEDIRKLSNEDTRLLPPSFIFDLGIEP